MCQYTPDNKRTKNTNQTKMCAIMVFYVYFVLYIELLFGNVGLNGSYIALNKADDGTLNGWMVGYSIYGAGFIIPIPSINNPRLSNKKVKIFTTSGWQECTSQPQMVTGFGSGYNVFYNDGLPEGLEHGKAFLCQFI